MNKKHSVIAIDGPAGSGKSTIAKMLAEKLGYVHADSGAIYRTLTLALMDKIGSAESPEKFGELLSLSQAAAEELGVEITFENNMQCNKISGKDTGDKIRTPEVTSRIRYIADRRDLRDEVNRLLQNFSEKTSLVADGRDMGSVVFPETPFKFFMDASAEIRARRRLADFKNQGKEISLEKLIEDIEKRDTEDRLRPFGGLKCPDGAIIIDTSGMSADDVLVEILSVLQVQF